MSAFQGVPTRGIGGVPDSPTMNNFLSQLEKLACDLRSNAAGIADSLGGPIPSEGKSLALPNQTQPPINQLHRAELLLGELHEAAAQVNRIRLALGV